MVRRVAGFAALCASIFVIYQGYENSRLTQETYDLSRDTACDLYGGCTRAGPTKTKTDFVRRQYEWLTQGGPYIVTCTRSKLFWGAWSCSDIEKGSLTYGANY